MSHLPRYVDLLHTRELLSIRQGINNVRANVMMAAKNAKLNVSPRLCWTDKISKLDALHPGWRQKVKMLDEYDVQTVLKKLEKVNHYMHSGNVVAHLCYQDDIDRLSLRDSDVNDMKILLSTHEINSYQN